MEHQPSTYQGHSADAEVPETPQLGHATLSDSSSTTSSESDLAFYARAKKQAAGKKRGQATARKRRPVQRRGGDDDVVRGDDHSEADSGAVAAAAAKSNAGSKRCRLSAEETDIIKALMDKHKLTCLRMDAEGQKKYQRALREFIQRTNRTEMDLAMFNRKIKHIELAVVKQQKVQKRRGGRDLSEGDVGAKPRDDLTAYLNDGRVDADATAANYMDQAIFEAVQEKDRRKELRESLDADEKHARRLACQLIGDVTRTVSEDGANAREATKLELADTQARIAKAKSEAGERPHRHSQRSSGGYHRRPEGGKEREGDSEDGLHGAAGEDELLKLAKSMMSSAPARDASADFAQASENMMKMFKEMQESSESARLTQEENRRVERQELQALRKEQEERSRLDRQDIMTFMERMMGMMTQWRNQ
jgi:hypothetical protein